MNLDPLPPLVLKVSSVGTGETLLMRGCRRDANVAFVQDLVGIVVNGGGREASDDNRVSEASDNRRVSEVSDDNRISEASDDNRVSETRGSLVTPHPKEHTTLDIQDSQGRSGLHYCAIFNSVLCAKTLIRGGCSVLLVDKVGANALYYALVSRSHRVVELLLRHPSSGIMLEQVQYCWLTIVQT